MIGKHMAAAIQKTGDIFGETGQKLALTKYEQEEQARRESEKERIRQEERAEDRAWKTEQMAVRSEMEAGKQAAAERRHQETLAVRKESDLARIRAQRENMETRIASQEKIASQNAERGDDAKLTPKQEVDLLQREVDNLRERLDPIKGGVLDDEERGQLERRLERLDKERLDKMQKLTGAEQKQPPDVFPGVTYNKGLIGEGMGARRPVSGGDKPAPKSDNGPKTITSQAEFDALPSGAVYIDPDDGKLYRKP